MMFGLQSWLSEAFALDRTARTGEDEARVEMKLTDVLADYTPFCPSEEPRNLLTSKDGLVHNRSEVIA